MQDSKPITPLKIKSIGGNKPDQPIKIKGINPDKVTSTPDDEWIEQAWFSTAVIKDEQQKQIVIDKLKDIAKKYPQNFYLLPDGTYGMTGTINGEKTSDYISRVTGLPMFIRFVNKNDYSQVVPAYTFTEEITITPDQEPIPYNPNEDKETQEIIQNAIDQAKKEQAELNYQKSLDEVKDVSKTKLSAYNLLSSIIGGTVGLISGQKETETYLGLAKLFGIPYDYAINFKEYNNTRDFKDRLRQWTAPMAEGFHLVFRGLMQGDPWAQEKDTEEQALMNIALGLTNLAFTPHMTILNAPQLIPKVGQPISSLLFALPEMTGSIIHDLTPNISNNEKDNELFKNLTSTVGMVLALHYFGKGTEKLKGIISDKLKTKIDNKLPITEQDIKTELETNPTFRGYFEEALKNPEKRIEENQKILKENNVDYYITENGIMIPSKVFKEEVSLENKAIETNQQYQVLNQQKEILSQEISRLNQNLQDQTLTIQQRENIINEIDKLNKLNKKIDNLIKENQIETEKIVAQQDRMNIAKEKERNLPITIEEQKQNLQEIKPEERSEITYDKENSKRISSLEQNREEAIKTEPIPEGSEKEIATDRILQTQKEIKETQPIPIKTETEVSETQLKPKRIVSEQNYLEAKNRLSKPDQTLNSIPIYKFTEQFRDWVTVGLYHLENGARDIFDFGRRMVKEFGNAVKPYIKNIYKVAKKVWDSIPYFDPNTLGALGGDIKSGKDLISKIENVIKEIELKTKSAKENKQIVEGLEHKVKPVSELKSEDKFEILEREYNELQQKIKQKGDVIYKDQQNYNVFSKDKEINQEIENLMKDPTNKKKVEEAVRGGRSWKLTDEISNGLIKTGIITERELSKLTKGSIANAEMLHAYGKLVLNKFQELQELRKKIAEAPLAEKEIFLQKSLELQRVAENLQLKFKGITAEVGRALNILKKFKEIPLEVKEELTKRYSREVAEGVVGYITRTKKIVEPNAKDWFFFIYYNTILSDPQTQLANLFGNSFMLGVTLLRKAIFYPDRRKIIGSVINGVKEGLAEAKKVYKEGDISLLSEKYSERTKQGAEVLIPNTKIKKLIYRLLPTTTLQAVDKIFIKILENVEKQYATKEIAELNKLPLEKVTEIIDAYLKDPNLIMADDIEKIFRPYIEHITNFARRGTFHQKEGVVLSSFKKAMKESVIGMLLCPFPTITVNFIKTAMGETPLALLELKKSKLPLAKKEIITRTVFGTIALSGLIYATLTGAIIITGRLSNDQEEIKRFKSIGLVPYHFIIPSLRIKFNYMNLSPYHIIFGQLGAFFDDVRRGKADISDLPTVISSIIRNSYKTIIDQNFMQTLNQIEKSLLQENEEKFWNQMGKIAISISGVTTPLGIPYRISKVIKGDYREYETRTPAEYFFSRIGLTQFLTPKLNALGEQVEGAETRLPIPTKAFDKVDLVGKWLMDNKIELNIPKKFKINNEEIDDKTYYNYVLTAGKLTKEYLLNIMGKEKGLTQEELEKMVKNDIEAIRNAVRLSIEKKVDVNKLINPKILANDIGRKKLELEENKIEKQYSKETNINKKKELLIKGREKLKEIEKLKDSENYKKLTQLQNEVTKREGKAIYIPDKEETRIQRIFEKGAIGVMVYDVNQILKEHNIDYKYTADKREKANNQINFNRLNRLLYNRKRKGKLENSDEEIINALIKIRDKINSKDYLTEIKMIQEVDKNTIKKIDKKK